MNKLLCLLMFTVFFVNLNISSMGQKIDTNAVTLTAKMRLLNIDKHVISERYAKCFIDYTPNVRFLSSDGFKDKFIFFNVYISPYTDTCNKESLENGNYYIRSYWANMNGYCTFAYYIEGALLYKLSGDIDNDFPYFYKDIKNMPFYNKMYFKSKKKFLSNFLINNVDLECLYDYFILNKKNNLSCLNTYSKIVGLSK